VLRAHTGTFRWPNGDRYDGEFVHDMCHGVGVHTYADGKQYKGEWKDNKKHGYGVMYWPKGSRTEGITPVSVDPSAIARSRTHARIMIVSTADSLSLRTQASGSTTC
jgi:hypothetical protein